VEDRGRDALNYSTTIEHRQAVSKEEIMALPDLHGYWKYGDAVVPFRLPLAPVKIRARGYIARELTAIDVTPQLPVQQPGIDHQAISVGEPKRTKAKRNRRPARDTKRREQAITPNHMQMLDDSAASISERTTANAQQQQENSGLEEPRQATLTLLDDEAFEQEQDGVTNI